MKPLDRKFEEDDVRKVVLLQLETMGFKPPHPPTIDGVENPAYAAFLVNYVRHIKGFTRSQMERGMAAFLVDYDKGYWPKLGQLLPYLQRVRDQDIYESAARTARDARTARLEAPKAQEDPERRKRVGHALEALRAMIGSGQDSGMSDAEVAAECWARADRAMAREAAPF